jgi:hypothetical protein
MVHFYAPWCKFYFHGCHFSIRLLFEENFEKEVDSGGRCETPVGIAGRLSSRPTEREHPGVVIN